MREGDECAICLAALPARPRKLELCGHAFHAKCIKRWFARSVLCPCCRRGSVEAVARGENTALATVFKRVLSRAPFPPEATDHDKIVATICSSAIMRAWMVDEADRAFLMILASIANDCTHFLDMLHRIRRAACGGSF